MGDSELFDETAGYDDEVGVHYADGLTDMEKQQAVIFYRLFNELWGVCIVKGDPGTGKDLFGNYLAHKISRFFPWKKIVRDEKPRELFGTYAGLFDEKVIVEELKRMKAVADGKGVVVGIGSEMERAATQWVTTIGEVLLKNSLLYLTEYWRYCYNREPHSPMNKTMGAIHKEKRHLDCLVVGTVQMTHDLDKYTCLPWVDWQVTCTRSVSNKTGFVYFVQKVKYDRRKEILIPLGRPLPVALDAGKPRTYLGDGKIRLRQNGYRPVFEEERIVLDVIRAGADTYEELVDYIKNNGDMSEREILDTLKDLKFRKSKRALDYPCYFGMFNSKSAPQLKTKIRIQED